MSKGLVEEREQGAKDPRFGAAAALPFLLALEQQRGLAVPGQNDSIAIFPVCSQMHSGHTSHFQA